MAIDRWVSLLTEDEYYTLDNKVNYGESWFHSSPSLNFGVTENENNDMLLSLHGKYLTDVKHILLDILKNSTSLSKDTAEKTIKDITDSYKKVWVWFE